MYFSSSSSTLGESASSKCQGKLGCFARACVDFLACLGAYLRGLRLTYCVAHNSTTSLAQLAEAAKRALGIATVTTMSFVAAQGEQVHIADEAGLRALLGSIFSQNVSIIVT